MNTFVFNSEQLFSTYHGDEVYIKDLLEGFPISGRVHTRGLGEEIPGGQRSRGRRGLDGLGSVQELRNRCKEVNGETIRRALARVPQSSEDWKLASEVWTKTLRDIEAGRSGEPIDLDGVDLQDVLLVECFGVWERHGESAAWKARDIHNFRRNGVNDCAWLPEKLAYHLGCTHMIFDFCLLLRNGNTQSSFAPTSRHFTYNSLCLEVHTCSNISGRIDHML